MRNRRAVALALSSSVLLTVAMLACTSDDTNSTFKDQHLDSGTTDTGPIFNADTGAPKADAPIVCEPSIPPTFDPKWLPPVTGSCAEVDLEGYYDACIANDSTGKSQFNTK